MELAEIWAHRGSSHKYIENTIPAFKQAILDGAEGIELDIQRTIDDELVVFHDEHLMRLTGDAHYLSELTYEELQDLTLKTNRKGVLATTNDAKIPRLEDVLLLMKETDLTVNIELKNSVNFYMGMEQQVLDLVKELDMLDQVFFSSFNHESMHYMSKLAGAEYCGLLTSDIQYNHYEYAKEVGVSAIHPMINSLQRFGYTQEAHENGLKVHVWTADEEAFIYAALLLGVDAIITNEPEKAVALREQFDADGGEKAIQVVRSLGLSILEG